jgi:hypothetical protein
MKTLLTTILLFLSVIVKAQQSDILYVPSQKSLVASYNYKQIGCYVGGYYVTTFPQPYIYTTPLSIVNRVGLTYVNKKNTFSIMGGAYLKTYFDRVDMTPDVWVKIYPLRMLTGDKSNLDFAVGVNYMNGFRVGIGLSIPYWSIYK